MPNYQVITLDYLGNIQRPFENIGFTEEEAIEKAAEVLGNKDIKDSFVVQVVAAFTKQALIKRVI